MSPTAARIVRGILRWTLVLVLTLAGAYYAVRTPFFEALKIPEGLRLVLSVEFVGLGIVSVLDILVVAQFESFVNPLRV